MTNLPQQSNRLASILQTLAEAYFARGQYAEAAERFEQFLQNGGHASDVYEKLALSYLALNEYSAAARKAYEHAFDHFSLDEELCLKICRFLLARQVLDDFSIRVYQRALVFHPPFEKEIYLSFFLYFKNQAQHEHAYEALKQVVLLEQGGEAQNLRQLASLGQQLGRADEVRSLLDRLEQTSPHVEVIRQLRALDYAYLIHQHSEQDAALQQQRQTLLTAASHYETLTTLHAVREFCALQYALYKLDTSQTSQDFVAEILQRIASPSWNGQTSAAGEAISQARRSVLLLKINNLEKIVQFTNAQLAENLAHRFLTFSTKYLGKSAETTCYLLRDGLIAFAPQAKRLALAAVDLLHKIENYNFSVPASNRLAIGMIVHAAATDTVAPTVQHLTMLHEALNMSTAKLATPNGRDTLENSSSRLLFERNFFERDLGAEAVAAKFIGALPAEVPGSRIEAYSAVWYNPLDYVDEKRNHLLGKFLVVEKLRSNRNAGTYRGRDRHLERRVIFKALSPQMSHRLTQNTSTREQTVKTLQRLGRLEQPGLALIYDMGYQQGLFFFVREYLEGTSLEQTLVNKNRLSPYEVLAIGIKVCRILQQTHKQQIFHCNLKPANIWLLTGGELKITDFFIPVFVETFATTKQLDGPRWHYSAPEWLQHGTPAPSCDIYAVGMILYELLCAEHPFAKHESLTDLSQVNELALPPLAAQQPQLPPLFASTIDRACDRSLQRRFKSLEEFEAALHASLEQMLKSDPAITKTGLPPSSFSLRRMLKAKHE